jgi:hypothetical protein
MILIEERASCLVTEVISSIVTLSSIEEDFLQVCAALPLLWTGTTDTLPAQTVTMIRQFRSYLDHNLEDNVCTEAF